MPTLSYRCGAWASCLGSVGCFAILLAAGESAISALLLLTVGLAAAGLLAIFGSSDQASKMLIESTTNPPDLVAPIPLNEMPAISTPLIGPGGRQNTTTQYGSIAQPQDRIVAQSTSPETQV